MNKLDHNNKDKIDFSSLDNDVNVLINDLIDTKINEVNSINIKKEKEKFLDSKYLKKNKIISIKNTNKNENNKKDYVLKEHIMSEDFKTEMLAVNHYIYNISVNNKIKESKSFMEFKDKENRKLYKLIDSITPNFFDINKDIVTIAVLSQMLVGYYFEANFNAGWAGIFGVTALFGGSITYANFKMKSLKNKFLSGPNQVQIILDKLKQLKKSDKTSDMIKSILLIIKNGFLYEKDFEFLNNKLDKMIKIYYEDIKNQEIKQENEILIEEILCQTEEELKFNYK